jgi:hypothetical protein
MRVEREKRDDHQPRQNRRTTKRRRQQRIKAGGAKIYEACDARKHAGIEGQNALKSVYTRLFALQLMEELASSAFLAKVALQ